MQFPIRAMSLIILGKHQNWLQIIARLRLPFFIMCLIYIQFNDKACDPYKWAGKLIHELNPSSLNIFFVLSITAAMNMSCQ